MSEIPMPASDPYQPAPQKSSGCGSCVKIGAVLCVVFIILMIIIAWVWLGSWASIFGGIFGGGGGTTYDTRAIASYSQNVNLYTDDTTFYYGEFDVFSSETQTTIDPDLHFDVTLVDTGTDSFTVTIHCAVYETDAATVVAEPWVDLNVYLVDDFDTTNDVSDFINLNNYADTYTWVIWFEASSTKMSTWTVDIDLTLRYNWG